jgi:hypothetical protein
VDIHPLNQSITSCAEPSRYMGWEFPPKHEYFHRESIKPV